MDTMDEPSDRQHSMKSLVDNCGGREGGWWIGLPPAHGRFIVMAAHSQFRLKEPQMGTPTEFLAPHIDRAQCDDELLMLCEKLPVLSPRSERGGGGVRVSNDGFRAVLPTGD